jgi:3-phenylpropionate/trans-cinnamate dioxygenase ferredoxin reductase subunit
MDERIIIIGAGEAGIRAALTLRQQGCRTPVTLFGDEPHAPYERPPLSKAGGGEPVAIGDLVAMERLELRLGERVEHIDRAHRRLVTRYGERLPYRQLLLATGARARRLVLPGLAEDAALTLRTLDDARRIFARVAPGKRVVIVGGGFVGLELAAALIGKGAQVSLLESQPRLLQRAVPAELARIVEEEHRARGVDLYLGAGIARAEPRGEGARLTLNDGRELEAELLVAGIGAEPNTQLAAGAGLALDNGIAVDAELRTSDPAIFAAGDCCSFPHALYRQQRLRLESWRCAREQGETAALNMLGGRHAYALAPWFWSDQFDLGLQIVGLPHVAARTLCRELGERARLLFHLDRDGRLLAASGIGPGNAVAKDIKLAERLINLRASPDPALLADPGVRLKQLLSAATGEAA